jgi:hypothetical protein
LSSCTALDPNRIPKKATSEYKNQLIAQSPKCKVTILCSSPLAASLSKTGAKKPTRKIYKRFLI